MTTDLIYLAQDGDIATIVLNRADKKNALTQAMWETLPRLVATVENDPTVKILILKSADPSVFSAGADIAEFQEIAKDPARRESNRIAIREGQRALARMSKPTVAEIGGACVGGGCGLALACDIRMAATGARLGITPAKLGLVYSLQDAKHLLEVVGASHAKSILYSGRLVDSDEALRIGLINSVHAAEDLTNDVRRFAQSIADNSQWSVRGIKQVIRAILEGATDDTAETQDLFRQSFDGIDHAEGVAAFLARRKPDFPFR
ncbi:enoyl-CoA hydratase/isomerase family protein [Govanella unica]|uniref:Enoyl-CoA hydratase-related protein n=1 Tax=Govanella unica TaxID=2975056 RepID=A0A9X3TUI2_9PROT|nr:enoyl-CoA hydratase-related protein [Govania unica]MDA5192455.1 enoyl-CoA hydratase-related protein [Govania unica]